MQSLLVLLLMLLLAGVAPISSAQVASSAVVDEPDTLDEQLAGLEVTLSLIAGAVASSTTLVETERIDLLTQLLLVSNTILQLRSERDSSADTPTATRTATTSSATSTKVSGEEIDLELVEMNVDLDDARVTAKVRFATTTPSVVIASTSPVIASTTAEAIATSTKYTIIASTTATTTEYLLATSTVEQSSSTITYEFDLVADPRITDPYEQYDDLREQAIQLLANELNVVPSDIERSVLGTFRSPAWDESIARNSQEAEKLASEFGEYSIVREVKVFPGVGQGEIHLITNLGESIIMELIEEDGEYEYFFSQYGPADVSSSRTRGVPYYMTGDLILYENEENILPEAVNDYLFDLFGTIPFTSAIDGVNQKIVMFLSDNVTYRSIPDRSYVSRDPEGYEPCYGQYDMTVFNQFMKYLADGLGGQYDDKNFSELVTYVTPVRTSGSSFAGSCQNTESYF